MLIRNSQFRCGVFSDCFEYRIGVADKWRGDDLHAWMFVHRVLKQLWHIAAHMAARTQEQWNDADERNSARDQLIDCCGEIGRRVFQVSEGNAALWS